jgi:nucleotide-binding universal stress UspA family protein
MSDPETTGGTTASTGTESERVFLVVVDDSEEMSVALLFACRRAQRTGGRVSLLYVQERADFQHWMAVEDLMRKEAREEGEALLQRLSAEVQRWTGEYPVLYIREGDRREELVKVIEEEPTISILVLGAGTGKAGPGPIISYLMGKGVKQLRVPITIIPGSLSEEEVTALS